MRLVTKAVVVVLLALTVVHAADAAEMLLANMMKAYQRWMRITVDDGRICLKWTRLQTINNNSGNDKSPVQESLRVVRQNNALNLTYTRNEKNESVSVFISGKGDTVSIKRSRQGDSQITPVEYLQDPMQGITFTIGDGDDKKVFTADGLWRLLVIHRAECEEHLYPLLEMMKHDWKIAETVSDIEGNLLNGLSEELVERRARWKALVAQLADDSFSRREAADRALRAEGADVVGFLNALDFARLDAEQRFRLRRILASIDDEDEDDDTAAEIADRLANDPAVWLALLARPEPEARKTAAKHLSMLLGVPLDIDPAAEPDTQIRQRARIKAIIENR